MKMEMFPVAILAGGLATRLKPISTIIPKSLVDINGEPFIAHQLRSLQSNGIKKVVLCIGFLGEQIEDFVGNGHNFNLDVTYSYDGETLLGTAGSIKKALPLLGENFFVTYGDSYLLCHYLDVQQKFIVDKKLALMSVFYNKNHWDKSNVEFNHDRIIDYDKKNLTEKKQHIDYGLAVFNRDAFLDISLNKPSDLETLFQELLRKNQLAAYEVQQRFYEVGSFTGIEEFKQYICHQQEIALI